LGTKWKKSKAVFGFLSFALGVSLILANALPLADRLSGQEGRRRLDDVLTEDFQETSSFRNYLSNLMNNLISMGAGGPLDSYYGYGYYGGDVIEGVAITSVAEDIGWEWGLSENNVAPSEADQKLWKQQAEAYHKTLQADKNILYCVEYEGKVLYSNVDFDLSISLPDGYGLWLLFDGTKCTAYKDGQETDLYGDGVYKDDGQHWYLPGYRNFPAGDDAAQVEVALAVADVPSLYVQGDYSSSGVRWQSNWLYWSELNWQQEKVQFQRSCALLVLGGVLLAVYIVLRKDKAQADRAIAGVTKHIWFELKLLLVLATVALLFFPFTEELRHLFTEVTYAYSDDGGYYWAPWFFSAYWSQVVRQPILLLTAFWAIYLFVNDLHYGEKPWRNGIFGMLRAKALKLPIQKRLSRRSGLATAALLLLALALLAMAVSILSVSQTLALTIGLPAVLLALVGVWAVAGGSQRQFWRDIGLLTEQIAAVKAGDLTASTQIVEGSDLYDASQELAQIGQGMEQAVAEQTRSERMKVELVTNVSHDIKTPLTSIISYAELLRQEQLDPPAGEYVEVLSQKAERLRAMVLDVFEVSKAASGNLPVKLEVLDLAKLLRQTLADMSGQIEAAPVTLRPSLPETGVAIVADGDRLYRVFQNLLQNALQYALEGSRVYLSLTVEDGKAVASVKNTSKTELAPGTDYTARFVRGDESRTDGGSGLGLAIAENFTAACGGELRVEPVADLFVVTVTFPLAENDEIGDCIQEENSV